MTTDAGTDSAVEWKPTACILCGCNCGILVRLGGDTGRRFEQIRGDKGHPASKGYTCQKALRLDHYQNGRGTTGRELYDKMLEFYPDRANPGSLWGSARAVKE